MNGGFLFCFLSRTASKSAVPFLALPGKASLVEAARGAVPGAQFCPHNGLAQSWSQSQAAPNLPRTSHALSSFIQTIALARQIHLPLTQD